MTWAEDQTIVPANRRTRPNPDLRKLVAMLAARPGDWWELDTYPAERKQSAASRGSQITKRYPGTDYSVMPGSTSGEVVLYLRVAP